MTTNEVNKSCADPALVREVEMLPNESRTIIEGLILELNRASIEERKSMNEIISFLPLCDARRKRFIATFMRGWLSSAKNEDANLYKRGLK